MTATALAFEFRVLLGGQRGCRLPLQIGSYRAGSAGNCDIQLDGLAPQVVGFMLHVDADRVELEAMDASVMLGGRPFQGRHPLPTGQVFSMGDVLLSVDLSDAPWPEDPAATAAVQSPSEAAQPTTPPTDMEPVQQAIINAMDGPFAVKLAAAPRASAVSQPPAGRLRIRLPFWAWLLVGTALFLATGISVLLVAMSPANAIPTPPLSVKPTLTQVVERARDHGDLKLEQRLNGGWSLTGYVMTREQRIALTSAARSADPTVRLEIYTDQDMNALARDTVARLSVPQLELDFVHFGVLALKGHATTTASVDKLAQALFNDVPGLHSVKPSSDADDAPWAMLQEELANAGLSGHVKGQQDGARLIVGGYLSAADRGVWLMIRDKLVKRFGASLEIVEEFRATPPQRSDIVLSVGGAVPYVVLSNGEKVGRSNVEAQP